MYERFQAAGCQLAPSFLDAKANLEKMSESIKQAREIGDDVKLAVFSELATTGMVVFPQYRADYQYRDAFHDAAEKLDGPTITELCRIAKHHGVYLATGFVEADPTMTGVSYNSAALIDEFGNVVAVHRKCHMAPSELMYFRAGSEPVVVSTPLGRVGLSICYDFWFPEFTRRQVIQQGCEIHINMTANVRDFAIGSTHVPVVRAAENSVYVVSVNRVGRDDPSGYEFVGHSSIVSPTGTTLASAGEQEEVIVAEVELEQVKRARTRVPVLKDFKQW